MKQDNQYPASCRQAVVRKQMKGKRGTCAVMNIIFEISFKAVATVLGFLLYGAYIKWMFANSDIQAILDRSAKEPVKLFISFVVIVIPAWLIFAFAKALQGPVYVGIRRTALKIADGQSVVVSDMLTGFNANGWEALRLTFNKKAILTLLNLVAPLGAAATYVILRDSIEGKPLSTRLLFLGGIALVWAIVAGVLGIVHIIYSMTHFVMAEDDQTSAQAAMAESARLLRKHKWQYFRMHISYLGWFLIPFALFGTALFGVWHHTGHTSPDLSLLIYGMLALELAVCTIRPFYVVGQANFYRYLRSVAVIRKVEEDEF